MKKASRRREHYYTPEIAHSICERLLEGEPLRQICQDPNMPARSTIFLWLERHKEFARWYILAKQLLIDDLMAEAREFAVDVIDWIDRGGADGKKRRVFKPENVRQSELKISALRSRAAKLMPKKYGWK